MVNYFKCPLEAGSIWDIPRELWDSARLDGGVGIVETKTIGDAELIKLLDPSKREPASGIWNNVHFVVVDPRPENRPQQRTAHVANRRSLVTVKELRVFMYGKRGAGVG